MWYKNLLLLALVLVATWLAFTLQRWLQHRLNPRKSAIHFIGFLLINLLMLFGFIFITGFLIIYFKDFFFKK